MAHLDLEFPRDIAQGCQGMLERRDEVVLLSSGHEETNQRWTHARRSWNAGLGIRSRDELAKVVEIFEAARGRANSFRFRDWIDWRSGTGIAPLTPTDQPLGIGNGTQNEFQLVKRYGVVNPYFRPIALPHVSTLRIAVNGVEVTTGWSVAAVGGLVTFDTAPPASAILTAGFAFDVPVRFAQSTLSVEWAYFTEDGRHDAAAAPDITLIEKRLDGGT